jgi:hypothetical protein
MGPELLLLKVPEKVVLLLSCFHPMPFPRSLLSKPGVSLASAELLLPEV